MIESAEIKFKAVNSAFDFSKVNVIVGENASGKTSIITALYWACTGKLPYGKIPDFIPWGEKDIQVKIVCSDFRFDVKAKKSAKRKVFADSEMEGEEASHFLSTKFQGMEIGMSAQGRSDEFMQMTPANRLQFLKKVLSFSEPEVVRALKDKRDALSSQVSETRGKISVLKEIASRPSTTPDLTRIEELKERQKHYQEKMQRQRRRNQVLYRIKQKGQSLSRTLELYKQGICPTCHREWVVDYSGIEKRLEEYRGRYAKISGLKIEPGPDPSSSLLSLQKQVGVQTARAEEKRQAEEDLAEADKHLKDLIQEMDIVKTAISVVEKEYPKWALTQALESVSSNIQNFIASTPTDIEIGMEHTDSGVSFSYRKSGVWQDVALASGFERQVLSLGFRRAIGDYIGCPVYLLDEADSFASSDNAGALLSAFTNTPAQVFIVTHKPAAGLEIPQAKFIEVK